MDLKFGFALFALVLATSACTETTPVDAPHEAPLPETTKQAVVDPDGPNWFAAGASGAVELIGGQDGQPDVITGRFVLDGGPIYDASPGDDRWVVVGAGVSQPLDSDALRLIEARDVLNGEAVSFIRRGPNGWIIGGGAGEVRTLDSLGEPTQNSGVFVAGAELVGADWNGNQWVLAGGTRAALANNLLNSSLPNGVDIAAVGEIRGIARAEEPAVGSSVPVFVFGPKDVLSITAAGSATPVQEIEAGLDITFAKFIGGELVLGTSDGRVGFFDSNTSSVPSWASVLDGAAVTKVEWGGSQYLALGVGGKAQLLGADGSTAGQVVQLETTQDPVAAWLQDGRWLIAFGESALVNFRGEQLESLVNIPSVLNGDDILAADVNQNNVLVGGENARIRLMNKDGSPAAGVLTTDLGGAVRAIGWNGTVFLVAGDGGAGQLVDAEGNAMGSVLNLNGGNTVHMAAWNGDFWLVGGEGNTVQRVRADGTAAGQPAVLENFATAYDARWNGDAWLVSGASVDGNAIYALISGDGSIRNAPNEVSGMPGAAFAVEYNGIEFVIAGSGGLLQRVSREGSLNLEPVNVLDGFDIYDLYFNGEIYIAGGELGAVRRISSEFQALRVPLSVLGQRTINAAIWTRTRGFPGGVCLNDEICYAGPCVGGIRDGRCCDSACDRPCESCFESDTGEADGTCAPVVADKQPPVKPNGPDNPCPRQSEATCGTTGACDGAGECQFYGAEITCGDAFCSNGEFSPVSTCNSGGMCATAVVTDCAPYVACSVTDGCATSCAADTDCVQGFVCDEQVCVEEGDVDEEARPPSDGGSDDGGCATIDTNDAPAPLAAFALFVGLLGWRRLR